MKRLYRTAYRLSDGQHPAFYMATWPLWFARYHWLSWKARRAVA